MRRRLLVVVVAVSTLVVVAFAVPLALLVRTVAEDRALTGAERDAAAIAPVLALTDDADLITAALERTETGAEDRLTVWLPGGDQLGRGGSDPDAVDLARTARTSFSQPVDGGIDVFTSVVLADGEVAVISAHVPDGLRRSGVTRAWAALGGVAVALIAGSALLADRLARTLTGDATGLAATARALAEGDAHARAQPSDVAELADAGRALNLLADRIDELRTAERERVADLSHRLRTPLTALRLDAEASGSAPLISGVDRLEAAVTELVRSARRPLHDGSVAVTVDLAAVVRDRAEFWSALAEEDGRPWTCDVHGDAVVVRGDREAFEAVVDALLANVHAHTPPGTAYGVRLDVSDGRARLSVDDAGPGFADPDLARERGSSGGGSSGLGLDIAARAAEEAGGTMAIGHSESGGAHVEIDVTVVDS